MNRRSLLKGIPLLYIKPSYKVSESKTTKIGLKDTSDPFLDDIFKRLYEELESTRYLKEKRHNVKLPFDKSNLYILSDPQPKNEFDVLAHWSINDKDYLVNSSVQVWLSKQEETYMVNSLSKRYKTKISPSDRTYEFFDPEKISVLDFYNFRFKDGQSAKNNLVSLAIIEDNYVISQESIDQKYFREGNIEIIEETINKLKLDCFDGYKIENLYISLI